MNALIIILGPNDLKRHSSFQYIEKEISKYNNKNSEVSIIGDGFSHVNLQDIKKEISKYSKAGYKISVVISAHGEKEQGQHVLCLGKETIKTKKLQKILHDNNVDICILLSCYAGLAQYQNDSRSEIVNFNTKLITFSDSVWAVSAGVCDLISSAIIRDFFKSLKPKIYDYALISGCTCIIRPKNSYSVADLTIIEQPKNKNINVEELQKYLQKQVGNYKVLAKQAKQYLKHYIINYNLNLEDYKFLQYKLDYKNIIKEAINSPIEVIANNKKVYLEYPLHIVVRDKDIVKNFIKKGANINVRNLIKETPLEKAIRNGYYESAKILLRYNADEKPKNKNKPPLHRAIEDDCEQILIFFKNINIQDSYGRTAVSLAAIKNPSMVKKLIEIGTNVDIRDEYYKLPLHYAVINGNIANIQLICNKSININAQLYNGNTALHLAVENNKKESARTLIRNGIDTKIQNHNKLTAEELAVKLKRQDIITLFNICTDVP